MEKRCTACGSGLRFFSREKFQLGQTGWLLGSLSNLLAGAMEIAVWTCPNCGKVELYWPEGQALPDKAEENHIAQIKCPFCGQDHDLDDVWCPHCDRRLDGAE